MDFLDPNKKRSHAIRLAIGYFLMVVLISTATVILVFQAYGFNFDRKTGEVIRNGLVFIDSAPDNATIKINGQEQKERTNTRLSFAEGIYSLEISKDGYRTWQRDFELSGGRVERFTYPTLFPTDLKTTESSTVKLPVSFVSQSPDRRWIILGQQDPLNSLQQIDLSSRQNDVLAPPTPLILSDQLFTAKPGVHTLETVEWSTDNKHILVKHVFEGGHEFVIINRDDPLASLNINTHLGRSPTKVTLHDKRPDKVYIYDQDGGSLQTVDLKAKAATQVVSGVLSYKSHGDDLLVYTIASPNVPTNARLMWKQKGQEYAIREIPKAANMPVDVAKFDNDWYVVVGVDGEQRAFVYKNPVSLLQRQVALKPVPVMVLKTVGPIASVSFSQNARFIMANSGQHFSVYDAETDRAYRYDVPAIFDTGSLPLWMDGHRLLSRSAGKIVVFDYDGTNLQTLVASDAKTPVMFDRDYKELYALNSLEATTGNGSLMRTELRIEND